VHQSGFHYSLKLLLGAILDKIDNVRFSLVIEALWDKGRFSHGQFQEVIQLLGETILLDDDILLARLCLLDNVEVED